jgi:hypothetical protein
MPSRHSPAIQLMLVALLTTLGACEVGDVSGRGPGGGSDSSNDPGASDGPDAGAADPTTGSPDAGAAVACDEPKAGGLPNGEHNPGQACLDSGCHGGNGGGPRFSLGGTLYSSVGGGAVIPGATIHVIDGNGTDITLTSASNGNFYTQQGIAFPVTVRASSCPNTSAMAGQVDQAAGNCNSSGCHDSGFRVHLP